MAELGVEKVDDKFEALRAADVVIVQMPLIEGVTNNTIAKAELEAMKPTAILINCSRGELVNEPDLCAALKSGGIAGAGLKGVGRTLKEFSLPISMSFRIFGALLSGALVTELVYHYTQLSFVLPVVVGVLFTLLHALIQAYVLTMLTALFYGEVSE